VKKLLVVVKKEFRQIRRTKEYFGVVFVAPFVMLLVLGSAITTEVKHLPFGVVDLDHSPQSRELVQDFETSTAFRAAGSWKSIAEAVQQLDESRVRMVLVVPEHFRRDLAEGKSPSLQLLIDGVDGNSAGVAMSYATQILRTAQARWAKPLGRAAVSMLHPEGRASPHIVPHMWFNPNLESSWNFVPGLLGIMLIIVTTLLTALNLVRERELGTLDQIMVTPLGKITLLLGKIIPFAILGMLQLSVGVLACGLFFGIWMKGSFLLLLTLALVFCFSTLALGIFVSTLAKTQQQAMFFAWFIMIFALLMAGLLVPIENMPAAIQLITYLNPLRYFVTVLREIFLKGTGLPHLWVEALAMTGIGLAAMGAAILRFQKRLE